ncbi:hypothetical protein BWQ96_06290 [Gracilariopsis chorda]|uniref:Uncharacterized protein n=1 Tax=Gracilariopsis chorda TaxID=448386 RepID=A0A2V3ISA1_9FLOR|nr:hypothetical protein BWQ96_06290 [Gracilariopsis chorda]|eukprot:PXF43980.1 hypothetical protein BWQ96_06290 [Gracilariopsis chorda]
MGSSLSTIPKSASRSVVKAVPPAIKQAPKTNRSQVPNSPVTARVSTPASTQQPELYQRPTAQEWAAALKNMSNVIQSSAWQGEVQPVHPNSPRLERHAAQRSSTTTRKLPQRSAPLHPGIRPVGLEVEHVRRSNAGRLTQVNVLELFNLRRDDPARWTAAALSAKYAVDESDVVNLLKYTRTYTGRIDSDGKVRAYYNPDPKNTISRFEND